MNRLRRDGTAEPVPRRIFPFQFVWPPVSVNVIDYFLVHAIWRERGQGNIRFLCLADHVQDWQPYLVDPYSCYNVCVAIHTHTGAPIATRVSFFFSFVYLEMMSFFRFFRVFFVAFISAFSLYGEYVVRFLLPIGVVGKRGTYQLVHGDLPRQHSFGTALRFAGPVPADSRQ